MTETRSRTVLLTILLAVMAIGGVYYYFNGKEYVYEFTEGQLQQALSERLPSTKTYLLIFQVTLDHPRVSLVNGSDRVRAGLDITLNVRVGDQPSPLSGSVDASGGVRYDPMSGRLFLTQPRIEHLELQSVPERYIAGAAAALSKALDAYYADHAIYTLNSRNSKELAARLVLKSVSVKKQRLVVVLGLGSKQ